MKQQQEMTEYLAAKHEWELLIAGWARTGKPGDTIPEAVKQAEERVIALKTAAGEGVPGDPLCCQRYSLTEPYTAAEAVAS